MTNTKTEKGAQGENKEKETSVMNKVFIFFCCMTLAGLVPFTYYGYTYTEKMKKQKPEGYHWPGFQDMTVTAISSIVFAILKISCQKIFYNFFYPLCKVQGGNDPDKLKEQDRRVKKMSQSFYLMLYFLFATSWGFIVLKDNYWFPKELGGVGSYSDTFKEFPYGNHCEGL